MAIVRAKGSPSFFITVTTNPKWREIQESLLYGQKATDRPDIVVRVFHMKLKQILHDLTSKNIFGRCIGYVYTVEYQKRGLPHAHILLILHPEDRPTSPQDFDRFVSAQIPDEISNPRLFAAVSEFMIHTCTDACKVANATVCKKGFPKGITAISYMHTLFHIDLLPS
jgi:hypothetical protein